MKKSKLTKAQIVFAIKQPETGVAVTEVCRKAGFSEVLSIFRRKSTAA